MDIESLLKRSTDHIFRGVFIAIITFCIIGFPSQEIQKDMKPVLKGPRPYRSDVADTSSQNRYMRLNTNKREHIFLPIIIEAAKRYSVDPALVQAIIMAESGYNPMAVSKKGAIGLMQLMPATAVYLGVEDSFNPEHNVNAGVRYLKKLLNQFEGDLLLAVAAYNAGSTNVRKYQGIPPYKATRYYVKKVLEYYQHYQHKTEREGSKI